MNTHVRNEIDNRYLSRTQHRQHGKWNCQQMEWCSRWQWHMCPESFLDKSKQCNTELEFLPLWLIVWRINKCYGNYKHCWRIDHRIKICHRTTRARSDLFRWPIETTFDYLSSACGARPNPSQFIAQLLSHCCIMLTLVSTTFHCSGSNLIFVVPFLWSHTFCSFHIDSLIATKLAPQRPTVQPRRKVNKPTKEHLFATIHTIYNFLFGQSLLAAAKPPKTKSNKSNFFFSARLKAQQNPFRATPNSLSVSIHGVRTPDANHSK